MKRYRVSADGAFGAVASVHLWAYDEQHALTLFHRVHGKEVAGWSLLRMDIMCFEEHPNMERFWKGFQTFFYGGF